jgi:uncharacterized protein YycO
MNKTIKFPRRFKKMLLAAIVLIFIAFLTPALLNWLIEKDGVWTPDYSKTELGSILSKEKLTEVDYHTLFLQTGLGQPAVDELLAATAKEEREKIFLQYQNDFFSSGKFVCKKIGIITYEERNRDEEGKLIQEFNIPDLKDGDVFITKATHSLGWRHGHAAIVTDARRGETLEAIVLGHPSMIQSVDKWMTYPSFIHLRLKSDNEGIAEQAAALALEELYDLPYGLFTGIPAKAPKSIRKTQCSHLVWYPFYQMGYDIDSDGSWLVTPKDIAGSDHFEVIQVYGVNPEEIWQ